MCCGTEHIFDVNDRRLQRSVPPISSVKSSNGSPRSAGPYDIRAALAVPGPGIRLLTFDDGGIRGLAMLLLLRKIMVKVQQASGLSSLPPPHEYFDIIGGSGTGGFIALLLGRLRLSIEDAIEGYTRIVAQVLTQIKADGSFKTTLFEKVLKEISHRYGEGEQTLLLDSLPAPCKAFVCTREDNGSGTMTDRRLRSYPYPGDSPRRCTFVEAARATMGHTIFFKPLSTLEGGIAVTYRDAGDDHYNPLFDILEEAKTLYPTRHIAYCLSLGAGTANTVGENAARRFINQPRLPLTVLTMLRHLADRCDDIAASFEAQHSSHIDGIYVRLTPTDRSPDGRIRWEQVDALDDFVSSYLTSAHQTVRHLINAMTNERDLITAASRRNLGRPTRSWDCVR
ncbi:acyl transferase/acyl hydrolase/lysophospholipase [Schizophyllum commune]